MLLLLGIRNPENLNEYDGGEETEAQDTLVEINSNINKESIGEEYLVFYEIRTV